jgi:hypothetical protein
MCGVFIRLGLHGGLEGADVQRQTVPTPPRACRRQAGNASSPAPSPRASRARRAVQMAPDDALERLGLFAGIGAGDGSPATSPPWREHLAVAEQLEEGIVGLPVGAISMPICCPTASMIALPEASVSPITTAMTDSTAASSSAISRRKITGKALPMPLPAPVTVGSSGSSKSRARTLRRAASKSASPRLISTLCAMASLRVACFRC